MQIISALHNFHQYGLKRVEASAVVAVEVVSDAWKREEVAAESI